MMLSRCVSPVVATLGYESLTQYTPPADIELIAARPAPPITAGFGGLRVIAGFIGVAAAAALRVVLALHYRIDSDETQHLHVVWGWSHGLLPYRDFFDNHMPLFHILCVPLLRLAGERPETIVLVRLAMLPMFAAMVVLTYRITASTYSKRAAAWAAAIGCLAPQFFLSSIEFRTDILWATSWLAAVAILVCGPLTSRRFALAGLALGIAAATSAKTSMLMVSLAIAAAVTLIITRERPVSRSRIVKSALIFAAASLAPVAAIAVYVFRRGIWDAFIACTVRHNVVPSEHAARLLYLPLSIAIITVVTRRIARLDGSIEERRRRIFVSVAASVYGAVLISIWPIVEAEHWLPFFPLVAAGWVPLLVSERRGASRRVLFAIVSIELFAILKASTPWRNNTIASKAMIEQAMSLTSPRESVIDRKGEIVFRPRAFYDVLERMTRRAISNGLLRDTIAEDVVRMRAVVSVPDDVSFPRDGRAFLSRNFIRVGCIRVAGMMVNGREVRIEVPGEYSLLSDRRDFRGTLDGTRYEGPRFLAAGTHTVDAPHRSALVWQRAAALGFSPFIVDRRCEQ
jgi:hypothetical protein